MCLRADYPVDPPPSLKGSTMNTALKSKRIVLFTPQVAGSGALTSPVVDMDGHESALFEVLLGALTAGQTLGTIQVQAGNVANGSDMAALAGALITIADADASKLEVIEVVRPAGFRYVRLVITRNSQAAAISSVVLTLHNTRKAPDSDDATTVAQTLVSVDPEYANSALTVTTSTYGSTTTQVSNTTRTTS